MNSENRRSAPGIGITSFVLIFVMLCLLTFAVLSLATARADLRLARRSADRTTAYYEAENKADGILLDIISCMEDCMEDYTEEALSSGTDPAGDGDALFYSRVRKELEGRDGIAFSDDRTLQYTVPLEEEQLLCVSLELCYEPFEDGSHYRILEWRTRSTHEWESDEKLPLLDEDSLSDMFTEE